MTKEHDRPRQVRVTLDLSREQHRFLRRFALEADTNAAAVLRALLALLDEDATVAERVVARAQRRYTDAS